MNSNVKVCPKCGSTKKRVFIVARDTVQAFGKIIEEAEDQLSKIEQESKTKKKFGQ